MIGLGLLNASDLAGLVWVHLADQVEQLFTKQLLLLLWSSC